MNNWGQSKNPHALAVISFRVAHWQALGASTESRKKAYRQLFNRELNKETIGEIRCAANTGLVLGNDDFQNQVEHLTGQRQHHLKRGLNPQPRSIP